MLVIGHRGAKGLEHENTLAAMQAGIEAGARILEFDVRLTRDGVPVVIHDRTLLRTHGVRSKIGDLNYQELLAATADRTHVPTLQSLLDRYWATIFLNIEIKGKRTGQKVVELLQQRYIKQPDDWTNCFLSSFSNRELAAIRKITPYAQLGLLHNRNPFTFIAYTRQLKLSAVGFHRLYANPLAIQIAKKSGLFTYAYTVNRPKGALLLAAKQLDAIVTDRPDVLRRVLEKNKLFD